MEDGYRQITADDYRRVKLQIDNIRYLLGKFFKHLRVFSQTSKQIYNSPSFRTKKLTLLQETFQISAVIMCFFDSQA